ncbi:hypothetical protein HO922_11655 [Streptococcus suis]|nr:hypothetical protein [Streptococcus suis]
MHIKPEHVYALVGFVSTVVGLWTNFSAKITKQENRITVLEKDIENLKEFKESANRRLDSHDEQNKAILCHLIPPKLVQVEMQLAPK